ncbi:MAG TPA: hypothetical protein DDY13_15010 [Cytophagales bacterium]|jgi:hypothetical protein|nr:hypothetical protein [Cytophagales bacterium]
MKDFKIPPISTLLGSTLFNYIKVIHKGYVAPSYYFKIFLTTLLVLISTPFHFFENMKFGPKLKEFNLQKPPLFILGHWRSGTTFLHNLLCQDPNATFVSTFQSVFPNNLASDAIFKLFMKINMPEKRPADNVKLDVSFPQEDEFALCNMNPNAYYGFFYFPEMYKDYFSRAIDFKISQGEYTQWQKDYRKLIAKAVIYRGGGRPIIKNPVNTGRIPTLLKMYPEARFLYIYRNPVTVFLSTRKFFYQLMPTLWLHKVSRSFIDKMIFEVYNMLLERYEKHKSLIPADQLMEIKFEEFEENPIDGLKKVYDQLLNEPLEPVKAHFETYISQQKNYKKNDYKVEKSLIDSILHHCGPYMGRYGYDIPDNVIV